MGHEASHEVALVVSGQSDKGQSPTDPLGLEERKVCDVAIKNLVLRKAGRQLCGTLSMLLDDLDLQLKRLQRSSHRSAGGTTTSNHDRTAGPGSAAQQLINLTDDPCRPQEQGIVSR